MRRNLGNKWQFLPLPVVVIGTFDKYNNPNAMTAAWSTVYEFGQVFVSIDLEHLTAKNLKQTKCFTLAFTTKKTVEISDYLGMVSGNDVNKLKRANLPIVKATKINAPFIANYPIVLECEVVSFNDGNLVGQVVNVNVDEKYLKNDGSIDFDKVEPVVYDMTTNTYRVVGKEIAKAFSVGSKLKQ